MHHLEYYYERTKIYSRERILSSHQNPTGFSISEQCIKQTCGLKQWWSSAWSKVLTQTLSLSNFLTLNLFIILCMGKSPYYRILDAHYHFSMCLYNHRQVGKPLAGLYHHLCLHCRTDFVNLGVIYIGNASLCRAFGNKRCWINWDTFHILVE